MKRKFQSYQRTQQTFLKEISLVDVLIDQIHHFVVVNILDRFCFREFLRYYYLATIKSIDNVASQKFFKMI